MQTGQKEKHGIFYITQSVALLDDSGGFLALRHRTGKWLLAGGHINVGEDWHSALLRELKEETGLGDVELMGVFQVDSWTSPEGPQYGTYFLGRSHEDKIGLSEEHIEYRWLRNLQEVESLDWWVPELRERAIRAWKIFHDERSL